MSLPVAEDTTVAAAAIAPEEAAPDSPQASDNLIDSAEIAEVTEAATEAADDASSAESTDAPDSLNLPTDIAGWRAAIATIPAKDLTRLISKDKAATARLFAGFRAAPDTVRRPLVVQRMAEAAAKEPKFAKALGALIPAGTVEATSGASSSEENAGETAPEAASPVTAAVEKQASSPVPATPPAEDPKLREKLKEQRNLIRDKDARIAALEASVLTAQRERDAARQEGEAAKAAAKTAIEEAERVRHKRDRDDRREAALAALAAAKAAEAAANPRVSAAAASAAPVAAASSQMVEEALQRLLTRGRYTVAAEVCREALSADGVAGASSAERGRIHALYAASLYGSASPVEGDEQDRIAAGHLLDAGELVRAAQSLGRILAQSPTAKPVALTPTFKRLSALAEKMNQTDAVNDVLTHVRISSPEVSRRLTAAISGAETIGRQRSSLLRPHVAKVVVVGPDEPIGLPTTNRRTATVTARDIVAAVDNGDAAFVADVRSAIRTLQAREGHDRATANALLETIAGLDATAALPLAHAANQPIVVDASNVARHNPDPLALTGVPQVAQLIRMREYLLGRGFFPVFLIADANLRFVVNDRPAYESLVERGVVHETPPGTSADEALIAEAHAYYAPLVTNDRMADWYGRANGIERLNFALLASGASLTPV